MNYVQQIRDAANDPRRLEDLYQMTLREKNAAQFASDLVTCHQEAPDNVLYSAWFYRLQPAPAVATRSGTNWRLAVPLSIVAGLLLWLMTGPETFRSTQIPPVFLACAPIEAAIVILFLLLTSRRFGQRAVLVWIGLAALTAYALHFENALPQNAQYVTLAMLHVPLLAWMGVGLYLVGSSKDERARFAFLAKSFEVFFVAAIFSGAAGAFSGMTMGLFAALGIQLADPIMRLLSVGVVGAVPLLAVALVYDPCLTPLQQRFEQGMGKVISTLMRLLLPLTLLVLVIYLGVIPFNFMAPFKSRDLLIVYNAMLFAVMALLIGATPVHEEDFPKYAKALRTGILLLSILATLVSVYALSATLCRTLQGALTPNRLTIIGWNCVNIMILLLVIIRLVRDNTQRWMASVQSALGSGVWAYILWGTFLVIGIPWLFH